MKQQQSIIKRVKDVNNWRRDNENNRYNGNVKKNEDIKQQRGDASYSERVRAK